MSKEKKKNKSYYHDKDNDFIECIEGKEGFFAVWVNSHLTLLFPHNCIELIPKNIAGFQVHGIQYIIDKAKEIADTPLTPKQQKEIDDVLKNIGWKPKEELEEK